MESARSRVKRPTAWNFKKYASIALMVLLTSLGLSLLNLYLYDHDFASNCLLYLGEKALLVHDGKPPRLENMGFTSPPFPHFFVLLVKNPFIASALVSGVIITSCLISLHKSMKKGNINFTLFALLFCYIIVSPLCLFLFSQQLPDAILIGLLLLSYHHLFKYSRKEVSYDLFLFGLLTAFIFLTRFQAVAVVPFLGLVLAARYRREDPLKSLAVLLTSVFPVFFISFSWCYLNWVFLNDPFYFLAHWNTSVDPGLSLSTMNLQGQGIVSGVKAAASFFSDNIPILLPYLLTGIWIIFSPRGHIRRGIILAIFLTPLIFLFSHYMTSFSDVNQDFLLLFIATAVAIRIFCHKQMRGSFFHPLFTVSILISMLMSFWLPCHHQGSEEQLFCQIITGQKEHGQLKPLRQLLSQVSLKGKILMDDTANFPLVYMMQEPKNFILPYEYEFEMVLAAPQHFVQYIIVSGNSSRDRILGRYPLATAGIVPGFTLVGRFGDVYLYETHKKRQLLVSNEGKGSITKRPYAVSKTQLPAQITISFRGKPPEGAHL